MERKSLFQAMLEGGFDMVSPVRANKAGYKFITLISSTNAGDPINVYFGVDSGRSFEVGDKVNVNTLFTVLTTNAAGEERIKLTNKSGDAAATLEAKGFDKIEGIAASSTASITKVELTALVGVSQAVRTLGREIANADTDPAEYCADVIASGTFTEAEVKYLQSKVPALAEA